MIPQYTLQNISKVIYIDCPDNMKMALTRNQHFVGRKLHFVVHS